MPEGQVRAFFIHKNQPSPNLPLKNQRGGIWIVIPGLTWNPGKTIRNSFRKVLDARFHKHDKKGETNLCSYILIVMITITI